MKITTLAFATLLLASVSVPVLAADPTDGKSEALAVEKMICQQLYVHQPAADVAYQPGQDVNGNAVAPADLPSQGAQIAAPDYIEVPLTVELAQRLDQPVADGVRMEGTVGNLRLYKDGRINYNGQDLTPQANVMCGKELVKEDDSAAVSQPTQNSASVSFTAPAAPSTGSIAPSTTMNPAPVTDNGVELTKKTSNFTTKKPAPAPAY